MCLFWFGLSWLRSGMPFSSLWMLCRHVVKISSLSRRPCLKISPRMKFSADYSPFKFRFSWDDFFNSSSFEMWFGWMQSCTQSWRLWSWMMEKQPILVADTCWQVFCSVLSDSTFAEASGSCWSPLVSWCLELGLGASTCLWKSPNGFCWVLFSSLILSLIYLGTKADFIAWSTPFARCCTPWSCWGSASTSSTETPLKSRDLFLNDCFSWNSSGNLFLKS